MLRFAENTVCKLELHDVPAGRPVLLLGTPRIIMAVLAAAEAFEARAAKVVADLETAIVAEEKAREAVVLPLCEATVAVDGWPSRDFVSIANCDRL